MIVADVCINKIYNIVDDKAEDPCNCATMFCPLCLEQQNTALHEVGSLLSRLEEAEALYPSSKAFYTQYPLYLSDQFMARVKVNSFTNSFQCL